MKRKVWPIFAWGSGVLLVVTAALGVVATFIDGRWGQFVVCLGLMTVVAAFVAGAMAAEKVTYEKKPRGWRKERRRLEKEAYVRKLEKELFDE